MTDDTTPTRRRRLTTEERRYITLATRRYRACLREEAEDGDLDMSDLAELEAWSAGIQRPAEIDPHLDEAMARAAASVRRFQAVLRRPRSTEEKKP